jgi:hypothetical protein
MSTPTTAAGMFRDAIAELVTDLEALGLQVVTDPRNARPFCVFVELPTFDGFNFRIADATVVLRVLASPPAAQNAADYLLSTIDLIMAANLAVVAGRPTAALIGDQNIPAYDLTVRIAIRREPTPPEE